MTVNKTCANLASPIVFLCFLAAAVCRPGSPAFAQFESDGMSSFDQMAGQLGDLSATTPVSPADARMQETIQKYEDAHQQQQPSSAQSLASQNRAMLQNLVNYAAISTQQHTGGTAATTRRDTRLVFMALRSLRPKPPVGGGGGDSSGGGGGSDVPGGGASDIPGGDASDVPSIDSFVSLGNILPGVQSELASIADELSNSFSLDDFAGGDGAQVPISFEPIYQNDPLSNYRGPSSAGIDGFSPTTGQYFVNGDPNNNVGTSVSNTNISPPSAALCGQ